MKRLIVVVVLVTSACSGGSPSSVTMPSPADYSCEARTNDIMRWINEHCQAGVGCADIPQVAFLPSSGAYVQITRRGGQDLVNITDIPPGSTAGESCPRVYGLDGPH